MADDFLADSARAQPDAPALDDGGRGWSYRELEQRVGAAAHRLRGAVASGSTVVLVSETTASAVMAVHAVLAAGAGARSLESHGRPETSCAARSRCSSPA